MTYRTLYPVSVEGTVLLRHDITLSSFFHTTRPLLLKTLLL